ncbi:MAG TPA: ATP-binding protein [Pyrinomonadaceae bacterium]|nr:ATP-binding protein [Pyrinomonadaceae bacterium]
MPEKLSFTYEQRDPAPWRGDDPTDSVKEKILIVDDSPTVRYSFSKKLSKQYKCSQAASYMEALAALREREFALVIADVQMPGISGIELLRKIVEKYPETSVIIVSAIDRPQVALDAIRLGAFDYLLKPCDTYILALTVQRALERRTLIREAKTYKADLEARNVELANGKAQLQRLQSQIVQNAKMASLGQLAAGVAHELNNPVGFVYGNIHLLAEAISNLKRLLHFYDDAHLDQTIADGAQLIKEQIHYQATLDDLDSMIVDCGEGAERIRDIVQNLRTFSRLDEAEFKKTDVHEGIDSTVRLLSRYFSKENITLVRDFSEIPLIDTFSGQLNQVWMNLLANAAQAVSPTGGEVRITSRHKGEFVEISIADTGKGIAAEHLERIFDPFFTTKPEGEGTGLGLSISFSIIQRHAGKIEVKTEIDEGTTFTVHLPIHARSFEFPEETRSLETQILQPPREVYELQNTRSR